MLSKKHQREALCKEEGLTYEGRHYWQTSYSFSSSSITIMSQSLLLTDDNLTIVLSTLLPIAGILTIFVILILLLLFAYHKKQTT